MTQYIEKQISGHRYIVFDTGEGVAGGGMYDCILMTDDLEEASAKASSLAKGQGMYPEAQVFDVEECVLRIYYDTGVVETYKIVPKGKSVI